MYAIAKRDLIDEDLKTFIAKKMPIIPKGTRLEVCGEMRNLYGHYCEVIYGGFIYSVKPIDLEKEQK
ncbi:MAG: hypothetical protein AB7C97_05670 [Oscillospiraceae bacterium]